MKHNIKAVSVIGTVAICAAILAAPGAQANQITGSIGFGAVGVTVDSTDLSTATTFSVTTPFATTESGAYAGVGITTSTPVIFNGFKFNPPAGSVTPLWTFNVGSVVYSFDATSVTSSYNSLLKQWDIGGKGMAMISGFTDTLGTWNVNLSQTASSFVFDSSEGSVATTSVTDGGSTLMMLGSGLMVLGMTGRKFYC